MYRFFRLRSPRLGEHGAYQAPLFNLSGGPITSQLEADRLPPYFNVTLRPGMRLGSHTTYMNGEVGALSLSHILVNGETKCCYSVELNRERLARVRSDENVEYVQVRHPNELVGRTSSWEQQQLMQDASGSGTPSQSTGTRPSTSTSVWTDADANTTIRGTVPYRNEPANIEGDQPEWTEANQRQPFTVIVMRGTKPEDYCRRISARLPEAVNVEQAYYSTSMHRPVYWMNLSRLALEIVRWDWETEEVRWFWEWIDGKESTLLALPSRQEGALQECGSQIGHGGTLTKDPTAWQRF